MSETQFEKLLKTLKTAERERDLSRHTVDVQDKIINDLREENERLRGLLDECSHHIDASDGEVESGLCERIEQEIRDECCQ